MRMTRVPAIHIMASLTIEMIRSKVFIFHSSPAPRPRPGSLFLLRQPPLFPLFGLRRVAVHCSRLALMILTISAQAGDLAANRSQRGMADWRNFSNSVPVQAGSLPLPVWR